MKVKRKAEYTEWNENMLTRSLESPVPLPGASWQANFLKFQYVVKTILFNVWFIPVNNSVPDSLS